MTPDAMSAVLPCQPRMLTIIWLDAGRLPSHTTVVFDARRLWFSAGASSDCDIIVTEPDFPQLAFQINWHPAREPLLYVHPAVIWLDGQCRQANLTESVFPLGTQTVIRRHGTRTVFFVRRTDAADLAHQAWALAASSLFPDLPANLLQLVSELAKRP